MKTNNQDFSDILRVQGINAKGYGLIPKLVMQDKRLSRDAKCIYAYMCSFAGAGDSAFPSVQKICFDLNFGDTKTFRKHRNQLEEFGYIQVSQIRGEKGMYEKNIYTLLQFPVQQSENPEKTAFQPRGDFSTTVNLHDGEIPSWSKSPTKSNSNYKINSINKNNNNGVVDIISIFKKQGIDVRPIIRKNPEVFVNFNAEEIEKIAETLAKKRDEGKIVNPVGMLMSDDHDPRAVTESILTGKFYPDKKKYTTTTYSEYELYTLPEME